MFTVELSSCTGCVCFRTANDFCIRSRKQKSEPVFTVAPVKFVCFVLFFGILWLLLLVLLLCAMFDCCKAHNVFLARHVAWNQTRNALNRLLFVLMPTFSRLDKAILDMRLFSPGRNFIHISLELVSSKTHSSMFSISLKFV